MKKDLLIIVSRILQGGIDNVLVEYLKQFDRTKFNIRLAIVTCMEEHEVCINDIPDDVEIHYLVKKHFLVKYRKMRAVRKMPLHKKIYDEALLNPIRRIIQKKAFDKLVRMSDVVIDFDSSSYSLLKGVSIPKIAFFHFSFSKYHNGNKRKLKRLGKKLDVYDKIATICDEMKNEGIRMYPDLKEKFVMIYNAFDFEVIRKKSLEIVESPLIEQPFIVAVQRLEESQKDSSTLIKSYHILKRKFNIKEKLYIIGDGRHKEDLMKQVHLLNLENDIVFLGLHKNPYPWIRASRLFVLSSKFEGLPTVLIEALSLEKTIISSNCPTGPKEILDNGKAGVLVPVMDEVAMAEAIHEQLADEACTDILIENIRSQIKKFDIRYTIKEIEKLLFELCNKSLLESGQIEPLIKLVEENRRYTVLQKFMPKASF